MKMPTAPMTYDGNNIRASSTPGFIIDSPSPRLIHLNNTVDITAKSAVDKSYVENCVKRSHPGLPDHFVIASGASRTLIGTTDFLHFASPNDTVSASTIQKQNTPLNVIGNLRFNFHNNVQASITALHEPNATYDLLSLNELAKQNITPCFTRNVLELSDGTILAPIVKYGDFYWLSKEYLVPPNGAVQAINKVDRAKSSHKYPYPLVHRMFNHANARFIKHFLGNRSVKFLKESDVDWSNAISYECPDCLMGKGATNRCLIGPRQNCHKTYEAFQYLHTAICRPVHNRTNSPLSHFISFTDEQTRFQWVYPLYNCRKESILSIFTTILALIDSQFNSEVLIFEMQYRTEYTNKAVQKFLMKRGITPCYTSATDSKMVSVAEQVNRALLNDCRTNLHCSVLPKHFWFSAIEFSNIIRNLLASPKDGKSPRQRVGLGAFQSVLLPFGHPVRVNRRDPKTEVYPRGILGYALYPSQNSDGYVIYLPSLKKTVDATNYVILQESSSDEVSLIMTQLLSTTLQ